MSEPKEQEKPLAPDPIHIENGHGAAPINRYSFAIKCCGCTAAVFLIVATIILALMFTEFRIKDPILRLNAVTLQDLEFLNNPLPHVNLTLEPDVSIKNPNAGSFAFRNSTTSVYYYGSLVGVGRTPAGKAGAKRTVRLNVTFDLIALGTSPGTGRLNQDLDRGILPISSCTRINGRVKISELFKRHMVVSMNCTMNVYVRSREIRDMDCRNKLVSL